MKKISFKDSIKEIEIELELSSQTLNVKFTEATADVMVNNDSAFDLLKNMLRNDNSNDEKYNIIIKELSFSNVIELLNNINDEFRNIKK